MMRFQVFFSTVLAVSASTAFAASAEFMGASAPIAFEKTTQVPGETLKAGSYSISIPEQIADRVIVRIDSTSSKDHALFLGVPSTAEKMGGGTGLLQWPSGVTKTPALRGFVFPNGNAVEFVYPKTDAAALAKANSAAVIAVDPRSEGRAQLKSLSKDELEIVNLWLLSLTTTGPDNKQPAVLARRYDGSQNALSPSVAANVGSVAPALATPARTPATPTQVTTTATIAPIAPRPQPVPQAKPVRVTKHTVSPAPEVAKVEQPEAIGVRRGPAMAQLPHTASFLPAVWMLGLFSLLGFGALRLSGGKMAS